MERGATRQAAGQGSRGAVSTVALHDEDSPVSYHHRAQAPATFPDHTERSWAASVTGKRPSRALQQPPQRLLRRPMPPSACVHPTDSRLHHSL